MTWMSTVNPWSFKHWLCKVWSSWISVPLLFKVVTFSPDPCNFFKVHIPSSQSMIGDRKNFFWVCIGWMYSFRVGFKFYFSQEAFQPLKQKIQLKFFKVFARRDLSPVYLLCDVHLSLSLFLSLSLCVLLLFSCLVAKPCPILLQPHGL